MPNRECEVEGCIKPFRAKKMCSSHYMRFLRHGDPLAGAPPIPPFADRFWAKVEKHQSGCWVWAASKDRCGYGTFTIRRDRISRNLRAHRVAFELAVGEIPSGMVLDHLCRNRACVNPEHLEPVTPRENSLRGTSPMARQAAQTHCKRGHELVAGNLVAWALKRRVRSCLTCHRARGRDTYQRRKETAERGEGR